MASLEECIESETDNSIIDPTTRTIKPGINIEKMTSIEMSRRNHYQLADLSTHFMLHYRDRGFKSVNDAYIDWSTDKEYQPSKVFAARYLANRKRINSVCDKICGKCKCLCVLARPKMYDKHDVVIHIETKEIKCCPMLPYSTMQRLLHTDYDLIKS